MMKKLAKAALDATIVPLITYIRRRLRSEGPEKVAIHPHGVVVETLRRAVADAADYADARMATALGFQDMEAFWRHAFNRRNLDGLVVEFGVWRGRSINYFASMTHQEIYGFDSFEGLQEDWKGWGFPKGHFSLGGELPSVAPNVRLIKGWFDQTLPGFLENYRQPFSFAHIDCDTYEAASTIFRLAGERIVKGTVIVFDEYFGYRGWRMGEFKAWQEFVIRRGLSYEYLGYGDEAVSLVVT